MLINPNIIIWLAARNEVNKILNDDVPVLYIELKPSKNMLLFNKKYQHLYRGELKMILHQVQTHLLFLL